MTKNEFLNYLHDGDFNQLFLESFWDNPTTSNAYSITVSGGALGDRALPTVGADLRAARGESAPDIQLTFTESAQKKGFRVYVCRCETLPDSAMRRFADAKLRKLSHDYLVIYASTTEPFHHLWSVPVKTVDKRQLVTIEYVQDDQAAFLLEKMDAVSFRDREPTIVDVVEQVNAAFLVNTADVTKKFYQGFRKQHDAFVKGIENLGVQTDREWYASVMLNRLMFCYFIQKKRFLNFDENYLGNKLKEIQAKKGKDKFYESFYRSFLKQLFSDGLDKPVSGRSDYFLKKYGRIPYLNGGMFSQHQIEKENKDIDIPDKVFENLFAFFDQWCWHLDNRITATGRDINPDVLGYIFEQYINDRAQMGAYYTKEDITEYIGRNCIVPYLFEAVKKLDAKPFAKDGAVWSLLKKSGDDYIFPAVRKGVDLPLPANIEKGVDTAKPKLRERRADWNKPADEAYALPTEIWRETVARRQRCAEIRAKIASGAFTDIHDFITYNLDIRAFAEDVIRKTDDHKLVLHIYKVLREMTILDPTCGSGAFLFAALNILEPLYEACLDRMEEWHAANKNLFKDELEEIAGKFRSNRQYFIYKNIILRNLYGVDIMHEATEIARLRLFLKMVAVVDVDPYDENLGLDPLPDIDFNIRCGNTLVGYATKHEIDEALACYDLFAKAEHEKEIYDTLECVEMAFDFFRREQLNLVGSHQQLVETKLDLNKRLDNLNGKLNDFLYTRACGKKKSDWLRDTQPFHWYAEFYPIMHGRGGFDVIIGNPPYVEYSPRNVKYEVGCYDTIRCSNLFALVHERSFVLSSSYIGLIEQMSAVGTEAMSDLRTMLMDKSQRLYYSAYPERPKSLFDGVCIAVSILISKAGTRVDSKMFSSGVTRNNELTRETLFQSVSYIETRGDLLLKNHNLLPKFHSAREDKIFCKIRDQGIIENYTTRIPSSNYLAYRTAGGRYWKIVLDRKFATESTSNKIKFITNSIPSSVLIAVLNSNLMWWYYVNYFDLYNFKDYMIFSFPFSVAQDEIGCFDSLGVRLMKSYEKNKEEKTQYIKSKGKTAIFETFNPKLSKPIIDEVDELLAKHYGFTEEELDFIINYDIKYRMGDELNAE